MFRFTIIIEKDIMLMIFHYDINLGRKSTGAVSRFLNIIKKKMKSIFFFKTRFAEFLAPHGRTINTRN